MVASWSRVYRDALESVFLQRTQVHALFAEDYPLRILAWAWIPRQSRCRNRLVSIYYQNSGKF